MRFAKHNGHRQHAAGLIAVPGGKFEPRSRRQVAAVGARHIDGNVCALQVKDW